jgi:hypothetical protein|nr:MAG TPA: hypothetical protein [Caudoviricetes sp.]DAT82791.1 MAG TPA: hypothetical protein [Caudoviricetes sp.]
MAHATLYDVTVTLGRAIEDTFEQEQINAWLADVEMCIRVRLGSLDGLDEQVLRFVEKEAVARRFRNPEGKTSERIDDFYQTLSSEAAKASLYITDEEWEMLRPRGVSISPAPLTPQWWTSGGPLTEPGATIDGFA